MVDYMLTHPKFLKLTPMLRFDPWLCSASAEFGALANTTVLPLKSWRATGSMLEPLGVPQSFLNATRLLGATTGVLPA